MNDAEALPSTVQGVAERASEARRADLFLAPVLERWGSQLAPSHLLAAARMRVRHGPMLDALSCLPSAGEGWLDDPDQADVRARVELLVWEAGGGAAVIPRLGPWLARSSDRWTRWVQAGARGPLFERVRAARLLEIAAEGLAEAPLLRREQARRHICALAEHPEPLVWIPAARTLGRLAGRDLEAQSTLTRWLDADVAGPRRRALTAIACVPAEAPWWPQDAVRRALDDTQDPWAVAALGPALPYLACERRELWLELVDRLASGDPGPEVLWSVVQGLLSLALRDALDRPGQALLRQARDRALSARPRATTQAQLWLEIQRRTDYLDRIDPDPEDLELLMRRAVRVATEIGPERVADRMLSLAGRVEPTFEAALRRAEAPGDHRQQTVALANLESAARAAALGLWRPVLVAAGRPREAAAFDGLPDRLLAQLVAHAQGASPDYPRHRALLRSLGVLVDGAARAGPSSVLRLLPEVPLADNKQRRRFRKPVADLVTRLLDHSLQPGLPHEVQWARFGAWYALAAEDLSALDVAARSSTLARDRGGDDTRMWQEDLRAAILRGHRPAEGGWTGRVLDALDALHAQGTPLAAALEALGEALRTAARARRGRDDDERRQALAQLAAASARWAQVLATPGSALEEQVPLDEPPPWPPLGLATSIVDDPDAGIKSPREVADAWAEGHGPVLRAAVHKAVERLLTVRSASSFARLPTRRTIGGYKLIEPLGSGAQGEIWLVERTRIGRRFVMKLLAGHDPTGPDAETLQANLLAEASILKRIYHPNVARFVDGGRDSEHPYLVLEYLIGCDLDRYARAKTLTLAELEPIVADVGAGLEGLGSYGLVHCDLKPQNVFLQLALPPEAPRFEPARDRDPALTPLLGAVVIDFGIARSMASLRGPDPTAMSGTLGYLAPEQTRGTLHPKTDVYALAATIYRALTGQVFFSDAGSVPARLMAHGETPPLRDEATRAALPDTLPLALIELLEDATRLDPEERPDVATFVARFSALVE